ncbi:MAG: RNA polymerase sigma factor [Chloroflexota bacterium]
MRSDETLAKGIQAGQTEAMQLLVDRYYDAILRYVFRMTGGRQTLAEDMVQESFLKMIRGIATYDSDQPFRPWLYAIATNVVRNHYRLADTQRTISTDAETFDLQTGTLSPENTLVDTESHIAVANALMRLPEHQRAVVVLYYYEDMPQKDIGDLLGIPVGTVKSRLSIGLKRLREMLMKVDGIS